VSARTDILDALERDGYKHREAVSLLERADKEPQTPTGLGDPEFPTTLSGGHALIVEYGDCEFYGRCQCGKSHQPGRRPPGHTHRPTPAEPRSRPRRASRRAQRG
jgi:hypothetical protein